MPMKMSFAFVLEYVKDVPACVRFYGDVLGMQPDRTAPVFAQFGHFAIASDESLSGKGEPELYWAVDDAEAAFRELSAKAKVAMPLTQKPFGKVFAIQEPNGKPRYVVEFARTRPSTERKG